MLDAKNLLYIPKNIKVISLVLLGVISTSAAFLLVKSLYTNDTAIISVSISLIQFIAPALIIALIAFYIQVGNTPEGLRKSTGNFINREIPNALMDIDTNPSDFYDSNEEVNVDIASNVKIKIQKRHRFASIMKIYTSDSTLMLYVQLNIKHIIFIYYIPSKSIEELEFISNAVSPTFSMAEQIGYKLRYSFTQSSDIDQNPYVVITISQSLDEDFLINPLKRLHLAQDFTSMTRSLILQAKKNKLL